MNFSFKKQFFFFILRNIFFLGILTLASALLFCFFNDGIGKFIIISIIIVYFFILLIKFILSLIKIICFIHNLSFEEKKQLEDELSNSLFSYKDCFLTNKYIFLFNYCVVIPYLDINKLIISKTLKLRPNVNLLYAIFFKLTIYTNSSKYFCFETNSDLLKTEFVKILRNYNKNI